MNCGYGASMDPTELQQIHKILEENRENFEILCKKMLIELKRINDHPSKSGNQLIIERPTFRIKDSRSIHEKTVRKGTSIIDLVKLKDLLGIRVICLDLASLDTIRDELYSSNVIEIIEEKRWIEKPDTDGYRGIHLIFSLKDKTPLSHQEVRGELQIRTVAQHFWASFSHRDLYKSGRVLHTRIHERTHQLSETLYATEKEVQRLDREIISDPLSVNLPNLTSLLDTLYIQYTQGDLEKFHKKIEGSPHLQHLNIPQVQVAMTAEVNHGLMNMRDIEEWTIRICNTLNIPLPTDLENKFFRMYAYTHGFYWPRRRLLELLLLERRDEWAPILGSTDPRELIIMLELSRQNEIEKFMFTWRNVPGGGISWSPLIDNRYTTKSLSELKLIDVKIEKSIESRPEPGGKAEKHRFRIRPTPLGLDRGMKLTELLFGNENARNSVLDELETEDFPGQWILLKVSSSISTVSADPGPTLIDREWWTGKNGYY